MAKKIFMQWGEFDADVNKGSNLELEAVKSFLTGLQNAPFVSTLRQIMTP